MMAPGGMYAPMMMSPMGMMMGSPFGYGLFGTPYCFGGGGFWTFYLLTRFRCKARNAEGFGCNARSGMFNDYCSFHRDGSWRKEKKPEEKPKLDDKDLEIKNLKEELDALKLS